MTGLGAAWVGVMGWLVTLGSRGNLEDRHGSLCFPVKSLRTGCYCRNFWGWTVKICVSDPSSFFPDPDPAKKSEYDPAPDPTFFFTLTEILNTFFYCYWGIVKKMWIFVLRSLSLMTKWDIFIFLSSNLQMLFVVFV